MFVGKIKIISKRKNYKVINLIIAFMKKVNVIK